MSQLPDSLHTLLQELRRPPLRDPAELRQSVEAHLHAVRDAATASELVDRDLAEEVATVLFSLLDEWPGMAKDHQLWVQAGVRYFSQPEYGEHDFESIVGFDDDVGVVNHVLERLGRDEMFIEVE